MTKFERAQNYLKKHRDASFEEVMAAAGCSLETTRKVMKSLGIPTRRATQVITQETIDQVQAYQRANPKCSMREIVEALGVTRPAVEKARRLMGYAKPGGINCKEAQDAEAYCMEVEHKVTPKELQEKFGISRYASVQIAAQFSEEQSRPETQLLPFDEVDHGPGFDKRRFEALRVPWNRVAEVLGAVA